MINFFKRIWTAILNFFKKLKPGPVAWKGANKAILVTTLIIWSIVATVAFVIGPGTTFGLLMIPLGLIIGFLISAGVILGLKLLNSLPKKLIWLLPGTYFLMSFAFGSGDLAWQFPLFVVLFSGATGAGLYSLLKRNRGSLTLLQKIVSITGTLIGLSGLVWGLVWLSDTGFKPEIEHINAAQKSEYRPDHIQLPNPSEPGPYEVGFLTYGSGKDKHRPEYAENATIVTDSVDGRRLVSGWEGFSGKLRTRYWGVDEESLPINGRVWYPKGEGPFPLALIVHGNHGMHDYSDPGYEYLGKLLASHGIIMTSVDENFINSGWTDFFTGGLDEENDARGWLLLEHLKNWRTWNKQADNIFNNKVDMNNLAVMGHSRGGEAAAIAGFFNKLSYYPDDAKQVFDFDFNIKAVVSIAPVDGQYKPGETGTPLTNVNYLVLHGANDGDVQSFAGLRQYERTEFTDSSRYFKSAVYIYGANHGQFNTTWGNRDMGMPYGSLLNVDALMPMEEQMTVGKTYISAFLQATLQGKSGYEPLFKDYRTGQDWLPETIYLNQYQSSDWQMLIDFEEDLDLTTTSGGGFIQGENLTVWREQMVDMKWGNRATRAAYIGWDSLAYEGKTASLTMELKTPIDANLYQKLTFELSESKEGTYPDKQRDEELKEKEEEEKEESDTEANEESDTEEEEEPSDDDKEEEEEKAPEPLDFSIQLTDTEGNEIILKLSDYSYLQRQVTVDVLKNTELQSTGRSEAVYNTFFLDLQKLTNLNAEFNTSSIASLKFVFDQSPKGVIILDKVAVH